MTGPPQSDDVIQRLLNAIACISSRDYPHVVTDAYLALRQLERGLAICAPPTAATREQAPRDSDWKRQSQDRVVGA